MPETPVKNGLDRPPVFWPGQQGEKPDDYSKISLTGHGVGARIVSTMEEASRFNVPFKTMMAIAASGLHSKPTNYDRRPGFDLNLSYKSMDEAESNCQFAPISPEKPVMRDQSEVARRQSFCMNDRPNRELNLQKNGSVAAEILVNVLQNDKLSRNSAADSSLAATSPPSENHNPVKEGGDVVKTRQQEPPRPQKQAVGFKEKPTVKKKYVRRNSSNKVPTTATGEVIREANSQTIPEPAKRSCRRCLKFDMEGEPKDDSMPRTEQKPQDNAVGNQSKSIQGSEVIIKNRQCGVVCDFDYPASQLIQDYSSSAGNRVAGTQMKATYIPPESGHVYTFKSMALENVLSKEYLSHIKSQQTHSKLQPSLPKSHTDATFRTEQAAKLQHPCWGQYHKRKRTEKGQRATSTTTTSFVQQYQHAEKPNIATGKVPNSGYYTLNESCANLPSWKEKSPRQKNRGPPTSVHNIASVACFNTRDAQPNGQVSEYCDVKQVGYGHGHQPCLNDLSKLMRYTFPRKKRTKNTRSLANFAASSRIKEHLSEEHISGTQIEAARNGSTEKSKQMHIIERTPDIEYTTHNAYGTNGRKKATADGSAEKSMQMHIIERRTPDIEYTTQNAIVLYGENGRKNATVDGWTEKSMQMHIIERTHIDYKAQNALVLYETNGQNGTVVPYYGTFTPIKKRTRAKVDLDDETNRVWKQLMEKINSEGIDGTDPETVKRWEEDRNVFHGRAQSFIARMHLVQGDRRFSQWKGSVVDSVIGVFLTQNVSDHLSSSAFMSLAARFPANSNRKFNPCRHRDTSSVIDRPQFYIVDPETARSNETPNHSVSEQSSMTLECTEFDEEKESVNGGELSKSSTCIINSQISIPSGESIKNISNMEVTEMGQTYCAGERKGASDILSCQNSAVSSQKSIDTHINEPAEKEDSFPEKENNLRIIEGIGGHMKCSFLELLQTAETTTLHDYSMGNASFSASLNFQNQCNYINTENDMQSQQMETSDRLRSCSERSAVPSNDCHVQSSTFGVKEIEDVQMITEEARYSPISEDKGINVMKDYTASTEESANHFSYHDKLKMIVQEASKSPFVHDPSFNNALNGSSITTEAGTSQMEDPKIIPESLSQVHNSHNPQNVLFSNQALDVMESSSEINEQGENPGNISSQSKGKEPQDMEAAKRKAKIRRVGNDIRDNVDWEALRRETEAKTDKRERTADTMDSVDWEAVRRANIDEIAETIKERGMNTILAGRVKEFLKRIVREHGNIDLEWSRDIEPDRAKEYLLSVRGLGLKSVECVRLLTLCHLAFPVDTNVSRIAVRLGWVPLQPLPESLQLHLLELYPMMESIQQYLWPRLCKLDQKTLYELHYQLITFGKVFCTKSKPNCNACPMRGECRHFASAFASARLSLPAPEEKGIVSTTEKRTEQHPPTLPLRPPEQLKDNEKAEAKQVLDIQFRVSNCKPIIEEPPSPEPEDRAVIEDIEDMFLDDPNEIPTIKLNVEEFNQNLQDFMQNNMELQEGDMSKALVAVTPSIPTPKLKNVSRLRTEHHVYEVPDSHPLVQELDRRECHDPSPYLLAIWTPAESVEPPQGAQEEYCKLCDQKTCFSCNNIRETNSHIVRGTLLIPCRTAMRGSFPLNGTYFQVNEVFADHDSSLKPLHVPRAWIWNLPGRTVYFATSVPSIFRGLTIEEIQRCFWKGYVCVRGFDRKTRTPRPLVARLHFPLSKLPKKKEKTALKQKKT